MNSPSYAAVRGEKGTVLLIVMIMVVVLTALTVNMLTLTVSRNRLSDTTVESTLTSNAAEIGMKRFLTLAGDKGMPFIGQLALGSSGTNWPDDLDFFVAEERDGRDRISCGAFAFNFRSARVEVSVWPAAEKGWYHIRSYASFARLNDGTTHLLDPGNLDDLAMRAKITVMGATCRSEVASEDFTEYMRFQTMNHQAGVDNLRYYGKLHSNGTETVTGRNVSFWEDVTSHGRMRARPDTIFHKKHQGGADAIESASMDDIETWTREHNLISPRWNVTARASAQDRINPESWWSRCVENAKTTGGAAMKGVTAPSSSKINAYVMLRRDKMDVKYEVEGENGQTYWFEEQDQVVPDGGVVYVDGRVVLKGELSRRVSFLLPGRASSGDQTQKAYITGSLRYVNDDGEPQYKLYRDTDGDGSNPDYSTVASTRRVRHEDADLTSVARMPWDTWEWAPRTWSGEWIYAENPDWVPPANGAGAPAHPQLGVVSGYSGDSRYYMEVLGNISGKNLELNFSGFNPDKTLLVNASGWNRAYVGSYIHRESIYGRGGSSSFLYDEHARLEPPPGFPQYKFMKPTLYHMHEIRAIEPTL